MAFDPSSVALGKKLGVVDDPRTFHLRTLLEPVDLPAVPRAWRMAADIREVPMFANDRYGDCTLASHGHRIVAQEFSSRQREVTLTDTDALEAYSAVTGFRRNDPATDNGAYMLDVANYMRRVGMGREKDGSRHTVDAFVKVDHTNRQEVKTACVLFGGVWTGVWLPETAQQQTGPRLTWDVVAGPLTGPAEGGSWGGHAIHCPGFNYGELDLWTWGQEQRMTWAFWDAYVDESYALISEDWFRRGGTTPRGFRIDQLRSWLSELG
jgi:hypothetical protein